MPNIFTHFFRSALTGHNPSEYCVGVQSSDYVIHHFLTPHMTKYIFLRGLVIRSNITSLVYCQRVTIIRKLISMEIIRLNVEKNI